MQNGNRRFLVLSTRLLMITAGYFALGIILFRLPEWASWVPGGFLSTIVPRIGEALVIASLVAILFERLMHEERRAELQEIIGVRDEFEKSGFKNIYVSRQTVFDNLLDHAFKNVQHELKILGICVSLFRESDRPAHAEQELSRQRVIDQLATLIMDRDCKIKVLYLKRYPGAEALQEYCAPASQTQTAVHEIDFYCMREWDEDANEFWGGKRLKRIANQSIGGWIRVYLELARRTAELPEDSRRQIIQRLKLKEYLAMPALSLYILDQEIYVTPYLYRRHCSDVPAFHIAGKAKPLYTAYYGHFEKMWNDRFTSWTVPQTFLEALIKNPQAVIESFDMEHKRVSAAYKQRGLRDEVFRESPEYAKTEEDAVNHIIAQLTKVQSASP